MSQEQRTAAQLAAEAGDQENSQLRAEGEPQAQENLLELESEAAFMNSYLIQMTETPSLLDRTPPKDFGSPQPTPQVLPTPTPHGSNQPPPPPPPQVGLQSSRSTNVRPMPASARKTPQQPKLHHSGVSPRSDFLRRKDEGQAVRAEERKKARARQMRKSDKKMRRLSWRGFDGLR